MLRPKAIEVMEWDGSRSSIDALCRWVNDAYRERHPGEDPIISYTFTGRDDVDDPLFAQPDGDFTRLQPGDWVAIDGGEPILLRQTWKPPAGT